MKKVICAGALIICVIALSEGLYADSVTITFDNLQDSEIVGSAYAANGVIFSGAVAATAGVSLNEVDFPPHSGSNVVIDELGPIRLTFATPVSTFSGYFTYTEALTLNAFGASNQLLATASSALSANYVSSGNQPNELIQLASTTGITSIEISGNPAGSSFALDDVTFTTLTPVPEPSSLALLGAATLVGSLLRWKRRHP